MMRGVARSFWAVVAIVLAVEAFIAVLAIRAVTSDLTCWLSGVEDKLYLHHVCGSTAAGVGYRSWIPALAVLIVCAATVLAGLVTLASQYIRTKLALGRLGAPIADPGWLSEIASMLHIDVQLCADDRVFCCCAGLLFPKVVLSRGMLELLDVSELTAVLAHEAAHVQHRDPARALAVRCASNALFYLPLTRYLSEKALVASELGADSVAVTVAGQPALVRALLDVLGRVRPGLGTVSEMASLDSLDSRIEALRTKTLPRTRPRAMIQLASVVVFAGLLLLGAWLPKQPHHLNQQPAHPVVHVSHARRVEPLAPRGASS
jgi:beta-lactamase regulating signal transducer with metallopeptidase domain